MNPTDKYARVICQDCGPQFLTYANYDHQMNRPNHTWLCPKCGLDNCQFDDAYYEMNFDETQEPYK